jgi:Protein of unknown function (DUF1573)
LNWVRSSKATLRRLNLSLPTWVPNIIEQANPTCGCTISDYTKAPIAPGKSGYISATYNAAGVGHFDKHLTVKFAGVDDLKSITISGDVVSAEGVPAPAPAGANDPMLVKAAPATPVAPVKLDAAGQPTKLVNKKTSSKKLVKKTPASSKK